MATLEELETKLKTLGDSIRTLEDIEEIKKLQRIYGYYVEHWMYQEIVDLFSDGPDVSVEFSNSGVFLGKEGVKRYFRHPIATPEFLHLVMQNGGVVDVDPDSKTAKGRWYGLGFVALPREGGTYAGYNNGIYECEYVKENGKWKFKKIHWSRIFACPYAEGWVKNPLIAPVQDTPSEERKPDLPTTVHKPYPSGYIVPFHYKHPITEK